MYRQLAGQIPGITRLLTSRPITVRRESAGGPRPPLALAWLRLITRLGYRVVQLGIQLDPSE